MTLLSSCSQTTGMSRQLSVSLTPAPGSKAWPELFSITRGLWIYNNHHQAVTARIKDANYQKLVQIEAELHQAQDN